jgi:hypothetical protein
MALLALISPYLSILVIVVHICPIPPPNLFVSPIQPPFLTKPFLTKPFLTKPFLTKPFLTKPFLTNISWVDSCHLTALLVLTELYCLRLYTFQVCTGVSKVQ